MTQNQKDLLDQKIKGIQPKTIKDRLYAIQGLKEKLDTKEGAVLLDLIFSLRAWDRDPRTFNEELNALHLKDVQNLEAMIVAHKVLRRDMTKCEVCKEGNDTFTVDSAALCQDCIDDIKHKYNNRMPLC